MNENRHSNRNPVFINTLVLALLFAICFTTLVSCFGNGADETGGGTSENIVPNQNSTDTDESVSPVMTGDENTSQPSETTDSTVTTDNETDKQTDKITENGTDTSKPSDTTTSSGSGESDTSVPSVPPTKSGSFAAETGTSLGFRLDWSLAGFDEDTALIDVKVVLSTYQLVLSARNNLGIIAFGDENVRFSTERIEQNDSARVEIVLHSTQLKIKADGGQAVSYIEAKWFFNGNYADTDYEWLTAGGFVSVVKE